jgi:hypothetical protein
LNSAIRFFTPIQQRHRRFDGGVVINALYLGSHEFEALPYFIPSVLPEPNPERKRDAGNLYYFDPI